MASSLRIKKSSFDLNMSVRRTRKQEFLVQIPLARGNRLGQHETAGLAGPIPARAGQPRLAMAQATPSTAYPRSRGATCVAYAKEEAAMGLSPLARGNLRNLCGFGFPLRTIPARAGQPESSPRN